MTSRKECRGGSLCPPALTNASQTQYFSWLPLMRELACVSKTEGEKTKNQIHQSHPSRACAHISSLLYLLYYLFILYIQGAENCTYQVRKIAPRRCKICTCLTKLALAKCKNCTYKHPQVQNLHHVFRGCYIILPPNPQGQFTNCPRDVEGVVPYNYSFVVNPQGPTSRAVRLSNASQTQQLFILHFSPFIKQKNTTLADGISYYILQMPNALRMNVCASDAVLQRASPRPLS